jgi:hypothetical protein
VILDADVVGTDKEGPEVVVEDVEAGHLQPWMLILDGDTHELFVVAEDPEPFHAASPTGRTERWVRVRLDGVETPFEVPATSRVDIVFGADVDGLQPVLEEDLYAVEQEALARNGLCHEKIAVESGDGSPETVMFCGRPSDPDSFYRFCTGCDSVRREESDVIAGRQFAPTYGPIPAP